MPSRTRSTASKSAAHACSARSASLPSSLHNRGIVRWPSSPAVQPSSAMRGSQIEAELERLGNVDRFSIIGYSMGGLIARYVVGKLYERGYFDKMQPLVRTATSDPGVKFCVLIAKVHAFLFVPHQNFITVATPHLGIVRPETSWFNSVYNAVATHAVSHAGTRTSESQHTSSSCH